MSYYLSIIKWTLKISNVHYNGGKNMKTCFLQLVWIRQIFGIVGFQIEIERIFSLARIVITNYLLGIVIVNNNIMTCGNSMHKNGE
jgi:hypothetical protein